MWLSACSKVSQPGNFEIEQTFTNLLPAVARVYDFTLEDTQNMTTGSEAVWHARFHATVKVIADTYASDGTDGDVTFLRVVQRAGESTRASGKSVSRLSGATWRVSIELDGQLLEALGQTESAFGPKKVIIHGSKAESAYLLEKAQKLQPPPEEKQKLLSDASKLILGTWRDENSICTFSADGTMIGRYDNGKPEKTTWVIEGDTIVRKSIEFDGRPMKDERVFNEKILQITDSVMVTTSLETGDDFHAVRVK